MLFSRFVKASAGFAVLALLIVAGILSSTRVARAVDDDSDRNESRVRKGFEIAPVHLNLEGKNRELVGLGSYIVNAVGDCNGCHSAGPATEFTPGHNPYFLGQTEQINTATYLGGGRDFGPYPTPNSPLHIISRNLTPDKTGRAEGGNSLAQFMLIMQTGVDLDHLHPNCSATIISNCFPPVPPVNGDLLQIMRWPFFKDMTEHDLKAIYEYLSAVPCVAGPASPSDLPPAAQYAFPALHNECN